MTLLPADPEWTRDVTAEHVVGGHRVDVDAVFAYQYLRVGRLTDVDLVDGAVVPWLRCQRYQRIAARLRSRNRDVIGIINLLLPPSHPSIKKRQLVSYLPYLSCGCIRLENFTWTSKMKCSFSAVNHVTVCRAVAPLSGVKTV